MVGIEINPPCDFLKMKTSYAKGFLKSVQKKLSNSKFVKNAPKNILDIEKKKALDTKEKIKILRKSLIKFN